MGFNKNAMELLLHLKLQGVNYTDSAMLGRQYLYINKKQLKQLLSKYSLNPEFVHHILSEREGYAEPFLSILGASQIDSFDASTYEHATVIHDMNFPISEEYKNKYSAVIDGGTLEHIFNFPTAIKNSMEMVEVGGHFIGITPANNFLGHGFYQFSPELFFRIFSSENGFKIENIFLAIGSKWFEIKCPDEVKARVAMINSQETFLYVVAKRIESRPIFDQIPQEGYYEKFIWEGISANKRSLNRFLRKIFLGAFYKALPHLGITNPKHFKKFKKNI